MHTLSKSLGKSFPSHNPVKFSMNWAWVIFLWRFFQIKNKGKRDVKLEKKKQQQQQTLTNKQIRSLMKPELISKFSIWFTSIEKTNWRVKFIMVSLLKITWNFSSRHHQGSTLKRVATKLLSTILLVFQCN